MADLWISGRNRENPAVCYGAIDPETDVRKPLVGDIDSYTKLDAAGVGSVHHGAIPKAKDELLTRLLAKGSNVISYGVVCLSLGPSAIAAPRRRNSVICRGIFSGLQTETLTAVHFPASLEEV